MVAEKETCSKGVEIFFLLRYFLKEVTGQKGLPFANLVPPSASACIFFVILGQLICMLFLLTYVFCPLAFASITY